MSAGLGDWLCFWQQQAQKPHLRTVPNRTQQEEAHAAYTVPSRTQQEEAYAAYIDDLDTRHGLQQIMNTDKYRKATFKEKVAYLKQIIQKSSDLETEGRELPEALHEIALLSHHPAIRESEEFQELKKVDLSSIINYCEQNKTNARFPYNTTQQEADAHDKKNKYINTWHWDNVRATVEHYYGPKNPITDEKVAIRSREINAYYNHKKAEVLRARTWGEWFWQYKSAETKEKLKNIREANNREIHYLFDRQEDQRLIDNLSKNTTAPINDIYKAAYAVRRRKFAEDRYTSMNGTPHTSLTEYQTKCLTQARENMKNAGRPLSINEDELNLYYHNSSRGLFDRSPFMHIQE